MSECSRPDCFLTDLHTHQSGTDGIIGQVCEHGRLKRKCEECDLIAEVKSLEAERDRLKFDVKGLQDSCAMQLQEIDRLKVEVEILKSTTPRELYASRDAWKARRRR